MKKTLKTILISILALVLIAGAGSFAVYQSKLNKISYDDPESTAQISEQTETPEIVEESETEKGIYNILLIGTDNKAPDEKYARADTMIIVSLDMSDYSIKLASIERGISAGDGIILNAYYHYNGPQKLVEKISEMFDVPIMGYVHVTGSILADIVDSVGGVDIELTQRESDALNGYIKSNSFTRAKVNAGVNHLDGYDAYQYCRQRYVDDDFGRMNRQKKTIIAIIDSAKNMKLVELNSAINSILPLIHTDLSKETVSFFALRAPKFLNADIATASFPETWDGKGQIAADLKPEVERLHAFLSGEEVEVIESAKSTVEFQDPQDASPSQEPVEEKQVLPMNWKIDPATQIPVLMFYGAKENDSAEYSYHFHSLSQIEEELRYLKDNGYNLIWFEDTYSIADYENPVIVLFEEGWENNYSLVFPIVKELEVKVSIAPSVDIIGKEGYLSPDQIKEMADSGFIRIEAMARNDVELSSMNGEALEKFFGEPKDKIEEITGIQPYALAYPYTFLPKNAREKIPDYYRFGISSERGDRAFNTIDSGYGIKPMFIPRGVNVESFENLLTGAKLELKA